MTTTAKPPIRSVSKQYASLQNINVKLKMFDLGEIRVTSAKDGRVYYYYYDWIEPQKTKAFATLKTIMSYGEKLLREKEAENHGED
jgi:hypothetical protein